jgi:hypothetical protein
MINKGQPYQTICDICNEDKKESWLLSTCDCCHKNYVCDDCSCHIKEGIDVIFLCKYCYNNLYSIDK